MHVYCQSVRMAVYCVRRCLSGRWDLLAEVAMTFQHGSCDTFKSSLSTSLMRTRCCVYSTSSRSGTSRKATRLFSIASARCAARCPSSHPCSTIHVFLVTTCRSFLYTGWAKKVSHILLSSISLPNIDRFSKSFHRHIL